MPMHLLEASVRSQPPVAIIDLQGEMTAEAEGVLNTAYAEAESQAPLPRPADRAAASHGERAPG